MSYKLTLTKEDRKAIDWIGDRYSGAPSVRHAFILNLPDDGEIDSAEDLWSSDSDLTVKIPENFAWDIQGAVEEDMAGGHSAWPCFAPSLRDKLNAFLDSIV